MDVVERNSWQQLSNGVNVKELIICSETDITGINYSAGGAVALSFAAGAELCRINFAANSCTLEQGEEDTAYGLMYLPVIRFEIPRPDVGLVSYMYGMRYVRMAALVRDGNERWWLVADGLRVLKAMSIGQRTGEGYELSASRALPVVELLEVSLDELLQDVEFSDEFGFEFNS